MIEKLLLWDIDGTLLYSGGVAGACMRAALGQVYGRAPGTDRQLYAGKTDQQIILDLHPELAADDALARFDEFADAYLAELQRRQDEFLERGHVLPGVPAILAALHNRPVVQSVLTGNHRRVARYKLELMGLAGYLDLDVGAYGSDHYRRDVLPAIAAQRAQARFQQRFTAHDVVVIGDTPHDIACGKAFGARTVAVASGAYTEADLAAHTPDALLPDLANTLAAEAAILIG